MLRTLRSRLIASHVLLLVIVIPLVGIALVYVLETQVLLVNLARQLTGQSVLVAELLHEKPGVWQDAAQASEFVDRVSPLFPGQLMLLASDGTVLASSDPADASSLGHVISLPGLAEVAAGQPVSTIRYSQDVHAEVADVMVPVTGADGQVVGTVRLTDLLGTVFERFQRLRVLIVGVLVGGLILGAGVGSILALTVERPLGRLTRAVDAFGDGGLPLPLPVEGPEETRKLAQAFERLIGRLHSLEEARHHLLSNLTHELGRPLGALRAATRALQDGAIDEKPLREELLAGMRNEIDRLDRLLDDLADLDNRVLGTLEVRRERVVLSQWLPELLSPWREAALTAGLGWQASIPANLPAVDVDPNRLGQALGNLLSNAIKFTPRGGSVAVTSDVEEGAWRFDVRDNGIGIPIEEQARIFEPFYRTSAERHYPYGLGLGLSIARDLVAAHSGEITVESASGRGSTFTVRLPFTTSM